MEVIMLQKNVFISIMLFASCPTIFTMQADEGLRKIEFQGIPTGTVDLKDIGEIDREENDRGGGYTYLIYSRGSELRTVSKYFNKYVYYDELGHFFIIPYADYAAVEELYKKMHGI